MSTPIIINCDDLGMHPDINDAIVDILVETPVRAASLMATGLHFKHAVNLLHATAIAEVGVHLVLGSEYEKLPTQPITRCSFDDFRPGRATAEEVEQECRQQIAKVLETGLSISHLDGHMFFYEPTEWGSNDLLDIVRRLSKELKVPFREPRHPRIFIWDGYDDEQARFAYYDTTAQATARAESSGQEWIVHPLSKLDDFGAISRVARRRLADYRYLKRAETWKLFSALGLECIGWTEWSERRKKSKCSNNGSSIDRQMEDMAIESTSDSVASR